MGLLSWTEQCQACWISLYSWLERYDLFHHLWWFCQVHSVLSDQRPNAETYERAGKRGFLFLLYLRQRINVFMIRIRIRVGTRREDMEESCGQKTCAGMDVISASFIWAQIRDWEKPFLVLNSHFSSSSVVPIHDITYFCFQPVFLSPDIFSLNNHRTASSV